MQRARSGTYRAALGVREFDAITGAFLISVLGDSAGYLAVTVLVYQRTGSPFLSSATFAVAFLPYLFGGTMLAALVDRLRPRTLLAGIDVIDGVLIALAAIPGVPIAVVFGALFVIGALAPVRSGAASAVIAEVLPGDTFLAGRSLQRICSQGGQIAGAGLGAALVAGFGARGALLADTASYLLSAMLIGLLIGPRPASPSRERPSLVTDSLGGVRAIWSHPAVRRVLLLGWVLPFVAVAPEGLAAPSVLQSGHHAALVGPWLAAVPVGAVTGDLVMVWALAPGRRTQLAGPLAIALPVLLIAFAVGPPLWLSIALLVLTGMATAYGLGLNQRLREVTPPDLLARMYALDSTGLMVIQGLGFVVAGALGQLLPAHDAIALVGGAGLLAVAALLRKPLVRDVAVSAGAPT